VAPRSALGQFDPAADRPDPVALLESQGADRIQGLLPLRYGRMLADPFAFFRGAALIMASDLSTAPHTGLEAQLCGDAHIANFGAYGSPERRLVFDVNDFDETHPGPFEWDVKRLVASAEIGSRHNGFTDKERRGIVLAAAVAYRAAMVRLADARRLDAWYTHIDVQSLATTLAARGGGKVARRLAAGVSKAEGRDSAQAFSKLATVVDGRPRIVSQPPLIVPVGELVGDDDPRAVIEEVRARFRSYRESLQNDHRHLVEGFEFMDLAHKVVGVGSVGTRCWIMLLTGRDASDPLFLQIKQASASVLEAYTSPSSHVSPGQRVVHGQRLMQAASDVFLGWTQATSDPHAYYVRQLRDWKLSADLPALKPEAMKQYVAACAAALAHAHARSGDRVAIGAYLGRDLSAPNVFDHAMVSFAQAYAEQSDRDFAALQRAVAGGRLQATT
jgi:uncharacterized protein (DUF2252 family)